MGGNATSPLHSWGSPKTYGTKSELVGPTSGRKCYITPAFSGVPKDAGNKIRIGGAHNWAEMLHHPCVGIPKDMGDKIRIGGAHKWAEILHHPCILGGSQRHGGQNQNWWGPQVGGNATSPLHSRGSPKTWGTKSELVGPTSGQKCYITPCVLGGHERHGEQNQNWWGPQVGGNATSPLHSRGFLKTWGTKSELVGPTSGRKCYITPAFSGVPKDMGDKIRIGGAHKWAEMLHHPCILGGSQRHGEQNQN